MSDDTPFDFAPHLHGPTVGVLLEQHQKTLEDALKLDSSSARIEVQTLLRAVLHANRAYLLSHPEKLLDPGQLAKYTTLLERRICGEPIAYILGEREFYGLNLRVSPATLIPRPETELLVDLALQRIPQRVPFRVLDLGTGSGAIALAIAHSRPDVDVTAVDASRNALEVARGNLLKLNISNIRMLHSDWFSAVRGERYDLIVSNPPYVAQGDAHLAQGDLRFEPQSALASGADGLDDIRRISAEAKDYLNADGWLLFEHGYDQAQQIRELLYGEGFGRIFSARDLAGIERVSGGVFVA